MLPVLFLTIYIINNFREQILSLFYSTNIFKIFTIFFCFLIIKYIYGYSYKQKLKLSLRRIFKYEPYKKYKIKDDNELDISVSLILLYIIIFIILMIISRFNNINKNIDTIYYLKNFKVFWEITPLFDILLNIFLIIALIILYFLILSLLLKIIRHHIIKIYLYIYLLVCNKEIVEDILPIKLRLCLNYYTREFVQKCFPGNRFIFMHVEAFQFMIHRIVLLLSIFYDLIYNNGFLTLYFKILPFVFLYELWVKLTIFLTGINTDYDKIIARLLYSEISIISEDTEYIYLNGEPYDKHFIKEFIIKYAQNNLVDNFYISNNPIISDFRLLLIYWKQIIFDPLIKRIPPIDLICLFILIIYSYLL